MTTGSITPSLPLLSVKSTLPLSLLPLFFLISQTWMFPKTFCLDQMQMGSRAPFQFSEGMTLHQPSHRHPAFIRPPNQQFLSPSFSPLMEPTYPSYPARSLKSFGILLILLIHPSPVDPCLHRIPQTWTSIASVWSLTVSLKR